MVRNTSPENEGIVAINSQLTCQENTSPENERIEAINGPQIVGKYKPLK